MSSSASLQDNGAVASSARQRAFKAARRRSRGVRVLRIVLPAIGVAAIVAFVALTRLGLPIELDLSNARLSITPNAIIMEHPNLTGFDAEQRAFSIAAERAVQSLSNPNQVRLEAIKAKITAAGHGSTTVAAEAGYYDHSKRTLRLEGDIVVDSAEGYALRMADVDIDFLAGTMQSAAPVTVIYNNSEITGQRFSASESGKRIVLDGGVRTTIMPPKRETTRADPAKATE